MSLNQNQREENHLYIIMRKSYRNTNINAPSVRKLVHRKRHDYDKSLINYSIFFFKIIRCSKDSNANIRRHLSRTHDISELTVKSQSTNVQRASVGAVRKEKLDAAAIRCIIRDGRPFCDFQKPGMAEFLATVAPGYKGPHPRTVQRNVKRLYTMKLNEFYKERQTIKYVGLTTDLWKRPGQQHHYLGVTVHYVDKDFQNISKVLSFRRFHGRHFSKRLRSHLVNIIRKYVSNKRHCIFSYGVLCFLPKCDTLNRSIQPSCLFRFDLEGKVVGIVTDNGSDVRSATSDCSILGVRLHCLAHGLNLAVQNGLGLWPKKKTTEKKSTDLDP